MPRLSAIGSEGNFSRLSSVIPPNTAPGWTSITTGVNPGSHGIYYFYNFSTSPMTIANSTDSSTPRIWDFVGAANGRSVLVNIPFTYPVRKLSGLLVSGIPPWYIDQRSVYPDPLLGRLRNEGYEIDTPMSRALERQPDALVERCLATERKRVDFFLTLLNEGDWRFGMVVLTALDRLQHKLLGKGPSEDRAVERGYRDVDELVGRIVDSVGTDANLLIVSDHGFNATPVAFYPNSWLHQNGLLKRRSPLPRRVSKGLHDLLDGHFLWMPQGVTRRYQGAAVEVRSIDAVDLEGSRAFVPGTDGVIVVKNKEDERRIASGLSQLKDDSGREICQVLTRDQVYKGGRLDSAPALLIVPREDVNIRTDPFSRSFISTSDESKSNHGPNGVFFAAGPGVRKSGNANPSLEDVAPTALALMGLRPPESMEGRVIRQALVEGPEGELESVDLGSRDQQAFKFSEDDERTVLDNLKRLGYA